MRLLFQWYNCDMPQKKRLAPEEIGEQIDAMGQDNEQKAAKAVIELHNQALKADEEKEAQQLEALTTARRLPKIYSYKEKLALYLRQMLREEHIPKGWHWGIFLVEKGIELQVNNATGTYFHRRRFKITGEPHYDLHACTVFAYWAGDIVYKKYREEKGDLLLPN